MSLASLTKLLGLSPWPELSRAIVRREHPHTGAQLSLFERHDGWRHTALITDAHPGRLSVERLELRHRCHARVEDRTCQAKAAGSPTLPDKEGLACKAIRLVLEPVRLVILAV